MSVQEIEKAISKLDPSEVAELADWFAEFQASAWDAQIERDSRSGKLAAVIDQARRDRDAGLCKEI